MEKEFHLKENTSIEIELREFQKTNESTPNKKHEIQVEKLLLDILKLIRRFSYSVVEVQEHNEFHN